MPEVTPKATVKVLQVGSGFKSENVSTSGNLTLKHKHDDWTFSLAMTDGTARNASSMKDLVATVDYKWTKEIKLTGAYDLGAKKYKAGASFDGKVGENSATAKFTYAQALSDITGEASYNLSKGQKVTFTFDKTKVLTGKLSLEREDYTFEPAYNFAKDTTSFALSKKVNSKTTLKGTYDLSSKAASVEWNKKPLKITIASTVNGNSISNPSVTAVWEASYDL